MSALARLFPLVSALALALLLACSPEAPAETPKSGRTGSNPAVIVHQADDPTPQAASKSIMQRASPATDKEALTALFNATNGKSWDNNSNWLSREPIGDWYGVFSDAKGRVVKLHLQGNQLSGEIPPELGNLTGLQSLGLSFNQLSGEIPPELGNLASLRGMTLRYNRLSGEIPPELGNLTGLRRLSLSNNQLSGEISPELGNLASLIDLHLHSNRLSGKIPPELGNLTSLARMLSLDSNQLSGEIPPVLGNLAILTELGLSNNQLSGKIPPELGNLVSLKILYLDGNQFVGCVPAGLQDQLYIYGSNLGDLLFCQ